MFLIILVLAVSGYFIYTKMRCNKNTDASSASAPQAEKMMSALSSMPAAPAVKLPLAKKPAAKKPAVKKPDAKKAAVAKAPAKKVTKAPAVKKPAAKAKDLSAQKAKK